MKRREIKSIFFASGVFYYFKTNDVKVLFQKMAKRFPGAVLAFDSCNRRGAKMMTKTWLKEAGMWMLFKKHFRKALVGDLGYDYTDANRITKAAKIKYREIIEKLPEFEKEDRFMTNMATKIFCRMGGKKEFTDSDIEGMRKTAALRAGDRNPYSRNMEYLPYDDEYTGIRRSVL